MKFAICVPGLILHGCLCTSTQAFLSSYMLLPNEQVFKFSVLEVPESWNVEICRVKDIIWYVLICVLVSSCLLGFLLGLLFTQRSGNYFVTMFDDYSATLPLVIVVVFETTSVAWVYGTDRWETTGVCLIFIPVSNVLLFLHMTQLISLNVASWMTLKLC